MSYVGFRRINPNRMSIWLALCLISLLSCLTQSSFAQEQDRHFREFDRTMVHSPTEMFRDLSKLISQDSDNPLADLDLETIKKLNKLGKEFIENLDDEQKKKAQEFAEKFLREKGLSSPEGKALMSQFGVSPEVQEQLAKEFDELSSADLEKFRELINQQDPGSGLLNGLPPRQRIPGQEPGKNGNNNSDQRSTNPRSTDKQGPGIAPGSEKDRSGSKNPFDENRFGQNDKGEPGENGGPQTGKGKADPGQGQNGKLDDPNIPANKTPNDQSNSGVSKLPNTNAAADPAGGKDSSGATPTGVGESGQANLEMLQDLAKRLKTERDKSIRNSESNQQSPSKTNSPNGKSNRPQVPSAPATAPGFNDQFEEQFQSWLKSQAIEKRFRDWKESGGASELQNRSIEAAIKKGFKGLGKSIGDTLGDGTTKGLSKNELKDKIERVMFEAAKDGMNPSEATDDGSTGPVDNAIGSLLDRFHDTVTKRQAEKRARAKREREDRQNRSDGGSNGEQGGGLDSTTPGSAGDSPSGGGSRSGGGPSPLGGPLGSSTAVLENFPEIPSMDFQKVLMFLALIGLGGFMVYLLLRNYVSEVAMSPARKFGKSFRSAKIRSPKDLVEAVDYFIVTKFGSESRWWNARHAREILCAGAPGYSVEISNLLTDYVRARYTRSDGPLPHDAQLNYKTTLQELSKQVLTQPDSNEPVMLEPTSNVPLPNEKASPSSPSQVKVE